MGSVRRNIHRNKAPTAMAVQARDLIATLRLRGLTESALFDIFGGSEMRLIQRGLNPTPQTLEMLGAMVERTEPKS